MRETRDSRRPTILYHELVLGILSRELEKLNNLKIQT